VCIKFLQESGSVRSLEIGQHLPTLGSKVECIVFLCHSVYQQTVSEWQAYIRLIPLLTTSEENTKNEKSKQIKLSSISYQKLNPEVPWTVINSRRLYTVICSDTKGKLLFKNLHTSKRFVRTTVATVRQQQLKQQKSKRWYYLAAQCQSMCC